MQLRQLLSELEPLRVEGPLDRDISGIAYDSRRVLPGMAFVAIPGHQTDGHEYIGSAIDRGASTIICERHGLASPRVTQVRVPNARAALAHAAAAFYEHPSRQLKVIGVTGTNGKTTVAFMVKQILESAGIQCGLLGTVRYEIGERIIPAQRTTPEALDVQEMLSQMVRAGCGACVMEVSSHALDQQRVADVDFDVGVFTNLTRDHLDYHGSMEEYFEAKRRLFTAIEAGLKRGGAVVNLDDRFGARLASECRAEVVMTYGLDARATLRATILRLGKDGTDLEVETRQGRFSCRLPLIGRHNVYNALAAVGAALVLDVDLAAIERALNRMQPVPGRLEAVECGQPFGVFVDYAHTDDALANVLRTLRELTPGRLLLAFGCGGNRDAGKRPRMGAVAASLADFVILTSDNPRREGPDAIVREVEAGFLAAAGGRVAYRKELDRARAIEDLLREARSGDTVVIAGKGHETYQEFEDTVIPFDDRVQAREALEAIGFGPMQSVS
jgi:UDP-N-acetylmuramoyl-L-alanyl-D-glutamate--2,6-diaminopimelate ligase